jgi:hypothetical protein
MHFIQNPDALPRSHASRLNYLLCEVVAIATPQVVYAFVTKELLRFTLLPVLVRVPTQGGTRSRSRHAVHACASMP